MRNIARIEGSVVLIEVPYDASTVTSVIDLSDLNMLLAIDCTWRGFLAQNRKIYVSGRVSGRKSSILLHRFITGDPSGLDVDHLDGDPLNNRRSNLEAVSHQVNTQNRHSANKNNQTSGVRGVCWDQRRSKWKTHYRGKPVKMFYDFDEACDYIEWFRSIYADIDPVYQGIHEGGPLLAYDPNYNS